jgi:hypothetical protein
MLGGMFVLGVVLFFAAPYLSMMVPVVLFEKLGTIDSIRRGIEIVNGKYWGNFGFLLLTLILGMVVGFIVSLFLMIFMFLAMLVFAFILIYYILIIAFSIWQQSWMTIAYITLYDINSGGSGKRKPRHSFVGMSR